jgi:hypothetical protein
MITSANTPTNIFFLMATSSLSRKLFRGDDANKTLNHIRSLAFTKPDCCSKKQSNSNSPRGNLLFSPEQITMKAFIGLFPTGFPE